MPAVVLAAATDIVLAAPVQLTVVQTMSDVHEMLRTFTHGIQAMALLRPTERRLHGRR
jgi:hypothetical protein